MHKSITDFLKRIDPKEISGKYIVEFGSLNVNGSARDTLVPMQPLVYEGYDLVPGPGVDYVADFSKCARQMAEADKPDVIICLNTLEHVKNWQQAVRNIKYMLRRGGLFLFSVPSKEFPWHNPPDYWRFSKEQIAGIFSDMKIEYLEKDPEIAGSIMMARALAMTGTVPVYDYHPDAVAVPEGSRNEDYEKIESSVAVLKAPMIDWDEI